MPAVAPDEADGEGEQGIGQVLADERDDIDRDVNRTVGRHREVEDRDEDGGGDQNRHDDGGAPVEAAQEKIAAAAKRHHASTALPFRANRPRGRFWMKRMMKTSTTILPSTAPA